jgi:hypothetical protein
MLKRLVHPTVLALCISATACAGGSDDSGSSFATFTGYTTQSMDSFDSADDMDDVDETSDSASSGDGDPTTSGDGDPTTSGDGDPTTTGDGDPTTTGDGDPTTTGDGDPGPDCGNGVIDPGETCDGNDFGGATCMTFGYDQGTLSCVACAIDVSTCSNFPQPGAGQLYSHCLTADNCPGLDGCVTVSMDGGDPYDGFCTNFCSGDSQCFANTGGTAVPQCNSEASPYCELDCSGGKTCPGGMECIPLVGGKQLCF